MIPAPLPFEQSFRGWMQEKGMRWEEEWLRGGVDADCRIVRLLPSREPRRVVVALHGAGNDALFAWIGLFRDLLEAGSEIHTFDLPGHGRASRSLFDLAAARGAIDEVFARCGGRHPTLPLHAVGVSLGGALLLDALARSSAGPVSATAMVAPLRIHLSLSALLPELTHRTFGLLWRERTLYGWTGLIPSFGRFKRDVYPLRLAAAPPAGAFGYVKVLNDVLKETGLPDQAERIAAPVLLVYGELDRVVPLAQGELLASRIPASEMVRIPGGTHLSTPLSARARARTLQWMIAHE